MRQVLKHPGRLRAVGALARLAQATGLNSLSAQGRQLPKLSEPFAPPAGNVAGALGPMRLKVAFLIGCVMPIMDALSHDASARLLQVAAGEVRFPAAQP